MILRNFKIAMLSAFLFLSISCTESRQKPFSFVQLCDTQLGMGGYEHDVQSFEQAVKQINELNPEFVVICGDLVNNATDSSFADFKRIVDGFAVPCYSAPGNHDIGNTPTDTSLSYYRKMIGKDYYYFQKKRHTFIVTNTQLWKIEVEKESIKHDNWFKNTLDSLGKSNTPIFVIGHYPIFLKSPEEEEEYFNLPLAKRKEILTLFKNNKVKAYLSGHRHETIINNYENIQLVSGESTSKNFDGRPLGFRLWQVSEDSIIHQFIPILLSEKTGT
jgi:3',5'-cyclic AMP phosphodiesterase CpdA